MKIHGLVTSIRKRNPYKDIMKKDLEHRTAANVLNREFSVKTPYRVLCTDITYMKFNHRFVYLSTVIGRFQEGSKATKEDLITIIQNKEKLKNLPILANVDFGHTAPMFLFPNHISY